MSKFENINVYINMFVHYPETYNAYIIENKFNSFWKEYFYNSECYVMVNSAPHTEEESVLIEYSLAKEVLDVIISNFKQFVLNYFNNQIKTIDVKCIDNK